MTVRPQAALLVGTPAAGKTSVARRIRRLTGGRAETLQLDEVHRRLCPPPGDGRRYHYEHGMLVLDDRACLIAEALDELNALLAARRRTRSLVLVEFASTDYAQTVKALPALREFELHVLSVTAPLEIARRRNRLRPPLYRVPDAFVTAAATASPDSLRGRVGTDRYAAIDNRAQWDPGALDARLRAVLVGWGLGPPGKLMCR